MSVPKLPSADRDTGPRLIRHQALCYRLRHCQVSPEIREAGGLGRGAMEEVSLREALAGRPTQRKGLPEGRRWRDRDLRKVPDGEVVGIHCWWSVNRRGARNTLHLPLTADCRLRSVHKSLCIRPCPSLDSEFLVDAASYACSDRRGAHYGESGLLSRAGEAGTGCMASVRTQALSPSVFIHSLIQHVFIELLLCASQPEFAKACQACTWHVRDREQSR